MFGILGHFAMRKRQTSGVRTVMARKENFIVVT
jgi:hypothetical protein